MSYSTQDDIKKQLPEADLINLSDDDTDGVADAGVVDEAIADADAEIDSYLSGRYTLPFSPVPERIKQLSVDIAIWNLYSRKTVLDEVREKRYNSAISFLKMAVKGEVSLGETPEPAGGEQQIKTDRTAEDRTFTIGKKSTGSTGSLDNY
ncbi:MAG: DUF1320 domain-containing protein [Pseudomonadota bacterium]